MTAGAEIDASAQVSFFDKGGAAVWAGVQDGVAAEEGKVAPWAAVEILFRVAAPGLGHLPQGGLH